MWGIFIRILMNLYIYPMTISLTLAGLLIAGPAAVLWRLCTRWPREVIAQHFIYIYGRAWLILSWPFVRMRSEAHLRHFPMPCVIIVNHRSFFDTFCMAGMPIFRVRIGLRNWPMKMVWYTPFLKAAKYINMEALSWPEILAEAADAARKGQALLIFPEGHRSRDGTMGRFCSGAFRLAVELNLPVIPVCLVGTRRLLPPGQWVLSPSRLLLKSLPPVDAGQFSGPLAHNDLRRHVKQAMADAIAELEAPLGAVRDAGRPVGRRGERDATDAAASATMGDAPGDSERVDARLRQHVRHCLTRSAFYRSRVPEADALAETFRGVADLPGLPLTSKADLEAHNDRFLAVEMREVLDICQTSGTTGRPVKIYQSASDLRRLGRNEREALGIAGVCRDDRVMIACSLGRAFMAGLAYFEGLRAIGAASIRTGAGPPDLLAEALMLHRPSVLIGVPSQLMLLADALEDRRLHLPTSGVRLLVCIGEPVRCADLTLTALAQALERRWAAPVRGTYAGTEIATSFPECAAGMGGHVQTDLVAVEVVGPDGAPVSPGQIGELVVTPLGMEATPLLRFRTGDMLRLYDDPCPCGRPGQRIGPVLGRKSQMLKIRGATVFPPAVYDVLAGLATVRAFYVEAYDDHPLSDRLRIVVSLADGAQMTAEAIAARVHGRIRVTPEVVVADHALVAARVHPPTSRKPTLFFDHRESTGPCQ